MWNMNYDILKQLWKKSNPNTNPVIYSSDKLWLSNTFSTFVCVTVISGVWCMHFSFLFSPYHFLQIQVNISWKYNISSQMAWKCHHGGHLYRRLAECPLFSTKLGIFPQQYQLKTLTTNTSLHHQSVSRFNFPAICIIWVICVMTQHFYTSWDNAVVNKDIHWDATEDMEISGFCW